MAQQGGDFNEIGSPNFTIGPPEEPVPQADLETRYKDKGASFDEVDYQSE